MFGVTPYHTKTFFPQNVQKYALSGNFRLVVYVDQLLLLANANPGTYDKEKLKH